jgi:hypothetical protein
VPERLLPPPADGLPEALLDLRECPVVEGQALLGPALENAEEDAPDHRHEEGWWQVLERLGADARRMADSTSVFPCSSRCRLASSR